MKKNVMMRVASALLVAVLMTTCAISGTFAKYTTTNSGSDDARVARWGFQKTALAFEMFDGEYTNVESGNGDNVVAPGTFKEITITLVPQAEAPEVAYSFDVDVSVTTTGDATELLNKLVWSLDGTEVGDFDDLIAAVDAKFDAATIEAGNLPAYKTIKIKWEWPFEKGDNEDEKNAYNAADTTLGNAAQLASLEVTVSFEATQLD